jgi:hypothetical protein
MGTHLLSNQKELVVGSHPAVARSRTALFGMTVALLLGSSGLATAGVGSPAAPPPGSPPLPRPPWTGNLLTGDRASFDDSLGGWTPSSGQRLLRVRRPTQAGGGALALVNTTGKIGTMSAASGHDPATYLTGVPGARYSFSFWARGTTAHRPVAGGLIFLDTQRRQVGAVYGMQLIEPTTAWVHVTDTTAIAPPGTRYVVAQALTYHVVPGETQFIDTALLQRAAGGATSVLGPLRTSGNRIIDGTGHPIILRGFVRMGLQGGPTENVPSSHDIAQAKSWGADVIRLGLGEQKWPGLPQNSCHTDPAYPSKVDNAVNLITGMKMYVILEMHWNTIAACGPAKPQPMADCNPGACNANAFWTALASRYRSNPLVGFDLYNEPHHIPDSVWRNGGKVTWQGVTYTAAGMQPMYNAIRATDATNLVFVTGNGWGNNFPATGPLSGTNIVYAAHSYTCPNDPPPICTNTKWYDGSAFLRGWVTPGKTYPVFVSEFGWPSPGNGRYAQSLISYAEQQHWSWTDFTWGNNSFSRFALFLNSGASATYEPTPGGMPALRTFPGS